MGAKKLPELNYDDLSRKHKMSSREAMFYVGWGRTKFWDLVENGELVGYFDGRWTFFKKDLDIYLKRKKNV